MKLDKRGALMEIEIPGQTKIQGKVRDIYDLGDKMLIVVTDRLSAFDVIMNDGVPGKGKVLNSISTFWFRKLADICPNHMISADVKDYPELFDRVAVLQDRPRIPHRKRLGGVQQARHGQRSTPPRRLPERLQARRRDLHPDHESRHRWTRHRRYG